MHISFNLEGSLKVAKRSQALIEFSTEYDSSVTLARLAAVVERQLTYNMKEATAYHE